MAQKLLKKPSIVSEVGDAGRVDPERLHTDIFGVENVMRLLQMLPGAPVEPPKGQRMMVDRKSVLATTHGVCRSRVKVGDPVSSGQPVAEVVDYYGENRETLVSPIDGIVAQLFYQGATNPGNIVMKIGKIAG
jgi:predicted deacylase